MNNDGKQKIDRDDDREFYPVTIHLTKGEMISLLTVPNDEATQRDVRFGRAVANEARDRYALTEEVKIEAGTVYQYWDGNRNTYKVVSVAKNWAIIRRMNANTRGPEGETQPTRISKIVSDVRREKAYIVKPEEVPEDYRY